MNPSDIELLERNGWTPECLSPLEIRHEDGSFATCNAAHAVLAQLAPPIVIEIPVAPDASYLPGEETASQLRQVSYLVEATQFEQQCLWERHHRAVPWEQILAGTLSTVGTCGGKPVCVSLNYARIQGHLVGFFEATSVNVDHDLVAQWLMDNCPAARSTESRKRANRCDASNFHQCLHALKDMPPAAEPN